VTADPRNEDEPSRVAENNDLIGYVDICPHVPNSRGFISSKSEKSDKVRKVRPPIYDWKVDLLRYPVSHLSHVRIFPQALTLLTWRISNHWTTYSALICLGYSDPPCGCYKFQQNRLTCTEFRRLYGITCLQTYSYYTKYSENDRWPMKSIVALMWWVIVTLLYKCGS
jgi:hypothetical protein